MQDGSTALMFATQNEHTEIVITKKGVYLGYNEDKQKMFLHRAILRTSDVSKYYPSRFLKNKESYIITGHPITYEFD